MTKQQMEFVLSLRNRLNVVEEWIEAHDGKQKKEKQEIDEMLEDLAKEWENKKLPSDGGLSEL